MSFDPTRVFTVRPQDVDAVRPWLEPLLERFAAQTGTVAAEDVIAQAKSKDAQLWSYHDECRFVGVLATRIHVTAIGKLCSLWVCVGDLDEAQMLGCHAEVERWARDIGCYAIEIVGREGWQKKLPGYTRKAIVLEKRLQETH